MLSAYIKPRPQTQRSSTVTIPAPLGGWNARDALAAMKPEDAAVLTNFWPATTSVNLRNGYMQHATGFPGQVDTLMTYNSPTANTLFAACGGNIYDATTAGAIGAASLTGKSNARWQYTNFTNSGGSYLLAVNGADKLISWDGSSWHKDGDGSPYTITNVDTAACANINIFKNRVWLIPTGSLKAWYLPLNAIGGAAVALDMQSLVQKGGYLMAGMTWTLDAGYGMDDYLAFITSQGEVIVWRLTDPTTPTGISIIGVFTVGSPIGRRCWLKYGGDLLIITQDGVVPMARALQSSRLDPRVSITDKIQYAVSIAISSYGANFGWQLLYFPKENQLYLNVPVREGTQQQQYVMNNISGAWCNFTGWEANCWETLNDNPYFGSNGFIGHAWNGLTDNNASISAFGLQSFQTFGAAVQKQCQMVRYHMLVSGPIASAGGVNVDYDVANTSSPLTTTSTSYGLWDVGLWDLAIWGADLFPSANWETAGGIGYAFAPSLNVAAQGVTVQWIASDILFEAGGVL